MEFINIQPTQLAEVILTGLIHQQAVVTLINLSLLDPDTPAPGSSRFPVRVSSKIIIGSTMSTFTW